MSNGVGRQAWGGLLTGRRPAEGSVAALMLQQILPGKARGSSSTFKALDTNGTPWWVKALDHNPDKRVVTETIVGAAGSLIGAPVCHTARVRIPAATSQWARGQLTPRLAHGSCNVADAIEDRSLLHVRDDDNRKRHVGVFALYDWCWGNDPQWLYAINDNNKTYSHDHGHYLPNGPYWDTSSLSNNVFKARVLPGSYAHLDTHQIRRIKSRLQSVTRQQLVAILSLVPREWPVTDSELESLGWFLEQRAPLAAARL